MELHESVGRAVATSGSSVCFAGMTVLIALAALSVVNIPFLTVMGLSAAGAVVVAVLAAIDAHAGTARLRRSPAHLLAAGPATRSRRQPPRATSRCPGATWSP